jgi:hypothetical protein
VFRTEVHTAPHRCTAPTHQAWSNQIAGNRPTSEWNSFRQHACPAGTSSPCWERAPLLCHCTRIPSSVDDSAHANQYPPRRGYSHGLACSPSPDGSLLCISPRWKRIVSFTCDEADFTSFAVIDE